MTSAMDRGGGRGQNLSMNRSKKLLTWGRVCVPNCRRLLWTVPSFNQKFEDFFVFNFLAAIEFRDLKLAFVYHLIVDIIQKTEVFCQRVAG